MGICQENRCKNETKIETNLTVDNIIRLKELYTGHAYIPIETGNKVLKSVCKIKIKKNGGKDCDCEYATGFFMNINNDSKKYLITNYHVISEKKINEDIEIEIHNHKTMNLKLPYST